MARISAAALFAAVLLACAVFAATAEEPAAVNRGHVTVPKHWLKSGIRVRNQDTGAGKLYFKSMDYDKTKPGCSDTVKANCFTTTWVVTRGKRADTVVVPVKDIKNTTDSGRKLLQLGGLVGGGSSGANCPILNLVLGPLHLDLLGLVVDTNMINLDVTAQPGQGQLLGNLLCQVAGLLDNPLGGLLGPGGALTNLLNGVTNLLGNLLNGLLGGLGGIVGK